MLLGIIVGLFIIPALLGTVVLVQLFRASPLPADKSNRINRIRLLWFALTRPDKFVPLFPWLENDEWDNSQQITKRMPDE